MVRGVMASTLLRPAVRKELCAREMPDDFLRPKARAAGAHEMAIS